jgi:hypothetical protein
MSADEANLAAAKAPVASRFQLRASSGASLSVFVRHTTMATFSVRTVLRWRPRVGQRKRFLYEERITLWKAESLDEAIELAEMEAKVYAGGERQYLDLLQAFWLSEEFILPHQGVEVFSLLRESDLEPKAYLDTFFESGFERQSHYGAEPTAPPNGGPATPVGNLGVAEGPPSVS